MDTKTFTQIHTYIYASILPYDNQPNRRDKSEKDNVST